MLQNKMRLVSLISSIDYTLCILYLQVETFYISNYTSISASLGSQSLSLSTYPAVPLPTNPPLSLPCVSSSTTYIQSEETPTSTRTCNPRPPNPECHRGPPSAHASHPGWPVAAKMSLCLPQSTVRHSLV